MTSAITIQGTTVMASITDPLRRAIRDADVTVYRIAKDSGISFTVVSRFHKGERDLTLATADKLADYFGLELRPREARPVKRNRRK